MHIIAEKSTITCTIGSTIFQVSKMSGKHVTERDQILSCDVVGWYTVWNCCNRIWCWKDDARARSVVSCQSCRVVTIATPEIRNSFSVVPVLPILFTDRPIYLWQCGVGPVHIVTGHENSSCDISDDLHNVKMIITNCRRNVPPCCFIYNLCLLGLHCVCTIRYNKWHGLSQLPIFVLHLHLQSIL